MSNTAPAIGIDLGTTNCCLGVFRFGKVEIIANDFGNRTTPSIVGFDINERYMGDSAKHQQYRNVENTVYDVKRLIGRSFDDPAIQEDKLHWPFKVIKDAKGKPKIQVTFKGAAQILSPEEISSMLLSKMKLIAEDYLGKPVRNAVITVPAYFDAKQRTATKIAANIAGLKVLRLLSEPTAAALSYGFQEKYELENFNVLVFDLGGGTFDVSIVTINDSQYDVLATGGNTHLGGEDFDRRMVNYFVEEFKKRHNKDISVNKRALVKLRKACELAKRTLAVQTSALIDVEQLFEGIDYTSTITRARFEELCIDLFRSTIQTVANTLEDAKMTKSQIDEIVMVGGSTRIPRIQKMVKDFFDGKEPTKSINPDEAVAYGACVAAAFLNGDTSKEILGVILNDVTPLSLGVGCEKDFEQMSVIIPRNTKTPASCWSQYRTSKNLQTEALLPVFQGESIKTMENIEIGELEITQIPPGPKCSEKIHVRFTIDEDGILKVYAMLESTKKEVKTTIETKSNLTKQEIDAMVERSQSYQDGEKERQKTQKAKNQLEQFAWKMKEICEGVEANTIPNVQLANIQERINDALDLLNSTQPISETRLKMTMRILRLFCSMSFPQSIIDE